jgi:hypothetical protein
MQQAVKSVHTIMTTVKTNIAQYWGKLDASWRFAVAAFLISRLFYVIWSGIIFGVQPMVIQNFELSGEPILSVFKLQTSDAYVYLREINGQVLTFQAVDPGHVVDQQTGSLWDVSTGTALQGQHQGAILAKAKTVPADIFPYHGVKPYPGRWLSMWQRFDANWYTSVAENGYGNIPGDDHFPPLFPLLIRVLHPLFGSAFLAGLFISHLATIITLKLLYDVFMQWGQQSIGERAGLFFVIYPTFFFFFSSYSEPIFLIAALMAFRHMQRGTWSWAGFWIFCAILTRLQGAGLLVPMLYFAWKDRSVLQRFSYWFGLVVSGLGGLFYLYLRSLQVSGDAIPFVEADWHARIVAPWQTYWYALETIATGNATFIDIFNWFVITLFIVLLVWSWKRIPLEYNLYTAVSIFIILIRIVETQPLISMSRYSLTLFPAFYGLSLAAENPILRRVIIYGSVLLQLYLSGQFFIWGWVA